MLSQNEIYLFMRMIERIFQCRICIIDGDGNYLFSTNFPEIDTVHLSDLCLRGKTHNSSLCYSCDNVVTRQHAEIVKTAFYKVCPYGGMDIVGTVSLPGKKTFQIFAGIFQIHDSLPENAMVYPQKQFLPYKGGLKKLSDTEFLELPFLMNMLTREITRLFEEQRISNADCPDIENVIMDYINGNFRRNVSLSDLAGKLGWSDSHTTVRVRRLFGKTFITLLNERRIENAKWLLREKYLPVTKIAVVSGFHCVPYFYKTFLRLTGMTPLEYRKKAKSAERSRQETR